MPKYPSKYWIQSKKTKQEPRNKSQRAKHIKLQVSNFKYIKKLKSRLFSFFWNNYKFNKNRQIFK